MKNKIILSVSVCLLGFLFSSAADNGPCKEPGKGTGKKNDIAGSINDAETKKPIKDVSITAYLSSKKEKVVIADGSGNYAFEDLKPGTYKFVFEKEGYRRVTKEKVTIKTDEAFQLNIEMIDTGDIDLMPSPFHFSNLK